jgi:very-short-patch-repair endonuclease
VGCPKCLNAQGINQKDDKYTWLDKIIKLGVFLKNGKLIYDYTDTVYEDAKTMVDVICPKHGPWSVRASSHLHDESGCPDCYGESRGEKRVAEYLEKNKIEFERYKSFEECVGQPNEIGNCRLLKFDFYLPELKTAVEIDGRYHFTKIKGSDLDSQIRNDKFKNKFIKSRTTEPEKLIRIEYKSGKFEKLIENLEKLLEKIKNMEKGTILLSDDYLEKGWNEPNNVE